MIGDFGKIIEAVNVRFRTQFSLYEKTASNEAAIGKIIDEMDKKDGGTPDGSHLRVARPTSAKQTQKAAIDSEFGRPRVAALLNEAESFYEALMAWR